MADKKNTIGVTNPHDKLIREVYGDRDNAYSFLINHLPAKVLDLASAYQTAQGRTHKFTHCDTFADLSWQVRMAERYHAADINAIRSGG